jgi:hypothetical protein
MSLQKEILKIAHSLTTNPEGLVDVVLSHPLVKPYADKTIGAFMKQAIHQVGGGSCNCNQSGGAALYERHEKGAIPGPYNQGGGHYGMYDTYQIPTDVMGRPMTGYGYGGGSAVGNEAQGGVGLVSDAQNWLKKNTGKIAVGLAGLAAAGLAADTSNLKNKRNEALERAHQNFMKAAQNGEGFIDNLQVLAHDATRKTLGALKRYGSDYAGETTLKEALNDATKAFKTVKNVAEVSKKIGVKPSDIATVLGHPNIASGLKLVGEGQSGGSALGDFWEGFKIPFKYAAAPLSVASIALPELAPLAIGASLISGTGQNGGSFFGDIFDPLNLDLSKPVVPPFVASRSDYTKKNGRLPFGEEGFRGRGSNCQCGGSFFGDIGDWVSGAVTDVGTTLGDTGKFIIAQPERAGKAFLTGATLGAYRSDDTKKYQWLPFGEEGFIEKNTGLSLGDAASAIAAAKGHPKAGALLAVSSQALKGEKSAMDVGKEAFKVASTVKSDRQKSQVATLKEIAERQKGNGTIGTSHLLVNINEDPMTSSNWGVLRGHPFGNADGKMAGNGSASGSQARNWTVADSGYVPTSRGHIVV